MASNRFSIGTGGNWVVTGGFVLNTERTFSSTYGVDIVNYITQPILEFTISDKYFLNHVSFNKKVVGR
jgi:hypothetical protein